MDEDEYKATYDDIAATRCVFEKALTNNLCKCSYSSHFCLADREGYACKSDKNASICIEFLEKIKINARFSLKMQNTDAPLPHNKAIRVQVGGIQGLRDVLHPELNGQAVNDVTTVIEQGLAEYKVMEQFPFSEIVQAVAAITVRKRSKNKKR